MVGHISKRNSENINRYLIVYSSKKTDNSTRKISWSCQEQAYFLNLSWEANHEGWSLDIGKKC